MTDIQARCFATVIILLIAFLGVGVVLHSVNSYDKLPKNSIEALTVDRDSAFKYVEDNGHIFMVLTQGSSAINFIHSPSCKCVNSNLNEKFP